MMQFVCAPGVSVNGTLRVPGDKSISHRAVILAAIAQGVDQGGQHPGPGSTDGMAQCYGAAMHIDPVPIPAQLLTIGQRLNAECLIGLDQIEMTDAHTHLLHQTLDAM